MRRFTFTCLRFVRVLAVVAVCGSTPTMQDIVVDVASWVTGEECCTDDCEQSGAPCQQECVHCANACHLVALTAVAVMREPVSKVPGRLDTQPQERARSGHLDPPFRPPVS